VAAEKDGEAKAMVLLEEAAKLGEVKAMVDLGEILLWGEHRDSGRAQFWLRKAADKDDGSAMNFLGQMFQETAGSGSADLGQAAYWYRKATQNGNAMAMYNLANMYASGVGVRQDLAEAKELFRRSDAAGNRGARARLAELESGGK
jgi:TPR repeat protein